MNPTPSTSLLRRSKNLIMERVLVHAIIAGLFSPSLMAERINLAMFQQTASDSSAGSTNANEAADGAVSNESRWYSNTDASKNHWIEIKLKAPYAVGSAHLYTGQDDWKEPKHIEIQYHNGSSWQTIPSTVRTNNGATDLVLSFGGPITATRFRAYTTDDILRVKEFALFPYNGGAGYPLGTDVILSLGRDRKMKSSSTNSSNHPLKAVDGWVDDNSRFLAANNNGPHTLTLDLGPRQKVGGIHLYSGVGSPTSNVLADFEILTKDSDGNWQDAVLASTTSGTISGNEIVGNTSEGVAVNFGPKWIETDTVQVKFRVPYGRIRELVAFPANELEDGSRGYPIGAGVNIAPRPSTNYKDYHDRWQRIVSRKNDTGLISDASGSSQVVDSTADEERLYQLLYSKSNDAYRIRAKDSGKCLEVEDASKLAGAAIIEGDYSAAPHQLWKLENVSGDWHRLINVYSGMVIETNNLDPALVTQQPVSSLWAQQWKFSNSQYYFRKGTGGWVGSFGTSWGYDWARNDKEGLGEGKFYSPMQHNKGWPDMGTLHKKRHDWNNDHKPAYLLGFNEPDRPDQANMSVDTAMDLWPRLMALDVPLVSPACALGGEGWMGDFMDRIDDKGWRCEYTGGHWYSGPSSTGLLNYIDTLQSQGNGRPVWLTEFSVVDWSGGSGDWSEESNYLFLMNFLWRAEAKSNLRKYAVFIFSGGVPTDPWDRTNPRSNFRSSSGNLHAFGRLYAAWDGDKTVRTDTPYLLHFTDSMNRLRNANSSVSRRWLRAEDDDIQWIFRESGNGNYFVISLADGKRLAFDGSDFYMAAPHTTGPEVEWDHSDAGNYGLRYLNHPDSGRRLRLRRTISNDTASFEIDDISQGSNWDAAKFRPIKPWSKASTAPPSKPGNPDVTPGSSQWELTWSPSNAADHHHFNVYRRVVGDDQWTMVATGVMTNSWTDTSTSPGVSYEYALTDVDLVGFESDLSASEAVDPNSNYDLWIAQYPVSGVFDDFEHDYDKDGLANGLEYAFLTDPTVPNGAPVTITKTSGEIQITYPWNTAASGVSLTLENGTTMETSDWSDTGMRTVSETNFGTVISRTIAPDPAPTGTTGFFRFEPSKTKNSLGLPVSQQTQPRPCPTIVIAQVGIGPKCPCPPPKPYLLSS